MNRLSLAGIFLILTSGISAQLFFSKNIDIDGYSDGGNSIHQTGTGYLITATSLCNNNDSECFTILNTDEAGNVINQVQYQNFPWWITAGNAHGNIGVALHEDAGMYFSGSIQNGGPQFDAFLMKTNEQGDSLWMKTYGTDFWEVNGTVIFSSDTSLMMLNASSIDEIKYLVWLQQLDLNGNVIWEDFLGEEYKNAINLDIMRAVNGDIIVNYLTCKYNTPGNPYAMTITRLDPQGNEKWTSRFADFDGLLSGPTSNIVPLDNGGFVVHYLRDNLFGWYKRPPILIWLDSMGNVTDQYDFSDFTQLIVTDLIKTSNGLIVGSGYADLRDFDLGIGGWVFAFTQEGEKLWERYIADLYFPEKFSWLSAIEETDDKGFALVGSIEKSTDFDIWLVKLDSMGCLKPGCVDSFQVLISSIEVPNPTAATFKVYPNPVGQNYLYLECHAGNLDTHDLQIRIADLLGQTMKSQPFESSVDVAGLAKGIYILTVETAEGKKIFVDKVIRK